MRRFRATPSGQQNRQRKCRVRAWRAMISKSKPLEPAGGLALPLQRPTPCPPGIEGTLSLVRFGSEIATVPDAPADVVGQRHGRRHPATGLDGGRKRCSQLKRQNPAALLNARGPELSDYDLRETSGGWGPVTHR